MSTECEAAWFMMDIPIIIIIIIINPWIGQRKHIACKHLRVTGKKQVVFFLTLPG